MDAPQAGGARPCSGSRTRKDRSKARAASSSVSPVSPVSPAPRSAASTTARTGGVRRRPSESRLAGT
ncbi:hypothetical protein ACIP93_01675 [Streptomyces sp. NPDC088745]|uniref:hypothetical protein n=1 Tax=Streptomyces sp. NPDC088745 TaxID=3365884 RepID=UPI00383097A4